MTLDGVFQNGQVRFDVPPQLPDGTRVRVKVLREPPPPDTREEQLAGILESIADMNAGRVVPGVEVMKQMRERVQHHLDRLG